MVRGRKPKPTKLRVIEGNRGKRPINKHEPAPPPIDAYNAPPWLSAGARAEWRRIVEQLARMGLLTGLDVAVLGAYCEAFARWQTAERALAAMAASDPVMGALMVKSKGGNAFMNPLVGIANASMNLMIKCAAEFGMTPSARSRVSAVDQSADDPLAELMGGGGRHA